MKFRAMENPIDPFINLPEPIIHHLMSLLHPMEAARTCILSKRFNSVWNSFPIIDINEEDFEGDEDELPLKALEAAEGRLQRFCEHKVSLHTLRLRINLASTTPIDLLQRVVDFAMSSKVEEVDLDLEIEGFTENRRAHTLTKLRPSLAISPTAKTLKILKLGGFRLDATPDSTFSFQFLEFLSISKCSGPQKIKISGKKLKQLQFNQYSGLEININACNLQHFKFKANVSRHDRFQPCEIKMTSCSSIESLDLTSATISDEWVKTHIAQFPLLEILTLCTCEGLKNVHVASSTLKSIKFSFCNGLNSVMVEANHLESFSLLHKVRYTPCQIEIGVCKFLRNLELENAAITDNWVEFNIPRFVLLETVSLSYCKLLNDFIVPLGDHVKSFTLVHCENVVYAEINSRKLASFTYEGEAERTPWHLVISSSCVEAKVDLNPSRRLAEDIWFQKVRNFLASFGHCKLFTLVCHDHDYNKFIVPREIRESILPPLLDLKHLEVEISLASRVRQSPSWTRSFMDSLLWFAPRTNTISIVDRGSRKCLKFKRTKPISDDDEEEIFCGFNRPQSWCWKNRLKTVTLENFSHDEFKVLTAYFKSNEIDVEAQHRDKEIILRKPISGQATSRPKRRC